MVSDTPVSTGSVVEKHRLALSDYMDVEVNVTSEGNVEIGFFLPNGDFAILTVDELTELVAFVEKHGQVKVYGEDV